MRFAFVAIRRGRAATPLLEFLRNNIHGAFDDLLFSLPVLFRDDGEPLVVRREPAED